MTTFSALIQQVEVEMALLGGVDVQTYAQPRIAQKLQRVFNTAYTRRFWKRHTKFGTYTLDGVTGTVTTDLSTLILNFEDIHFVWLNEGRSPLPETPNDVNPATITQVSIQAIALAAAGKFRVVPIDTSANVTIKYRTRPPAFTDSADVPFDDDYLVLATTADYMIDNGTNPTAAQKRMQDAQARWQLLLNNENAQEKSLHSSTSAGLTEWSTR